MYKNKLKIRILVFPEQSFGEKANSAKFETDFRHSEPDCGGYRFFL